MQHRGAFKGAAFLPDGTAVLLVDQGDGVRLLRTDAALQGVLGEVHLGSSGDSGTALARSAVGLICITGTSSSGNLAGSPGVVFPSPVDSSTNSFLACFDDGLNLRFLTFLGAARTAACSVALSGDAVLVGGLTYSGFLPTTPGALQQAPPSTAGGNGFLERFSMDGARLEYATYLGGSGGDSSVTSLAVDMQDTVFAAGATSAHDFPSVAALQPVMMAPYAGFLAALESGGGRLLFSTFVAGTGLSSVALSQDGGSLLLTGGLDPEQFPIADTLGPVVGTQYQGLVRMTADGQTLQDSLLLFPGDISAVSAGPGGSTWITGALAVPLNEEEAHGGPGEALALHLDAGDHLDALVRLGGVAANYLSRADLTTSIGAAVVNADSSSVLLPGTVHLSVDPQLAPTQALSLGLSQPTELLPNDVSSLSPTSCAPDAECGGSAGLLVQLVPPDGSAAVELSSGDLPLLTLRNNTAAAVDGLVVTSKDVALTNGCPQALSPGMQCSLLLAGSGPGELDLGARNVASAVYPLPSFTNRSPSTIALSDAELDFGVVTTEAPVSRTLRLQNLGSTDQTVASAPDSFATLASYSLAETSSTCSGPASAHLVPAGGSCALTLELRNAPSSQGDGIVNAGWQVGDREVLVTGFAQTGSLQVSAKRLDFGPQPTSSTGRLPRFLYLSNLSPFPAQHQSLDGIAAGPFQVGDACPSILSPGSVCQLEITYAGGQAPAFDSTTLSLDQGLTALLTGAVISNPGTQDASPSPSALQLSAEHLVFTSPVISGQASAEEQELHVTNTAANPVALQITLLGDFRLLAGCPQTLAPAAECTLSLQFAPSAPGQRAGLLFVQDDLSSRKHAVTLGGASLSLIQPQTSDLDMGEVPAGEPVVRWFQLQTLVQQLRATVTGAGLGVALLQDHGGEHGSFPPGQLQSVVSGPCFRCWVGVKMSPTQAGSVIGTLLLDTGDGISPLALPVHGWARPAQGVLMTPAQNQFGSVPVGSQSTPLLFTVVHASDSATPVVLQPAVATGGFHVVAGEDTYGCGSALSPGAACGVWVVFAPETEGQQDGTLRLETSAGTLTATLHGRGLEGSALALNPTTLTFSSPGAKAVRLTNRGSAVLALGAPLVPGSDFLPTSHCGPLLPGATCEVEVRYTPQPGASGGLTLMSLPVQLTDLSGRPAESSYAVGLQAGPASGDGELSVFPSSADFGAAAVNQVGAVRQFSLTNAGTTTYTLQLNGTQNFPLADPTGCVQLRPGGSCTFSILFLPQAAGFLNGTIQIVGLSGSGPSVSTTLTVQGYGMPSSTLALLGAGASDSALDFGQVQSGAPATKSFTLSNTGSTAVHLRRLVATTPFHAQADCATELAPGDLCTVQVSYAPVLAGTASPAQTPRTDNGSLTFGVDANTDAAPVFLLGGVQPRTGSADTLTTEVSPTLTLSATALTFAAIPGGATSKPQDLTLTNTGSKEIRIQEVTVSQDFSVQSECFLLQPGETCQVHVSFTPNPAIASPVRFGSLRLSSTAAVSMDYVTLLGSVASDPLRFSASLLEFGSVLVGASSNTAEVTLTNTSSLPVSFSEVALNGSFTLTAGTCPSAGGTLASGASCTFRITFQPATPGMASGSLEVSSPGLPSPVRVLLSGQGLAGKLIVSEQVLDFGSVAVGSAITRVLTIENGGDADLQHLHVTLGAPQGAFLMGTGCASDTLPAGASCQLSVGFSPDATGTFTGQLTLASSDPGSPAVVALTGSASDAGVPGILLTVGGGTQATATIQSGSTAQFPLLLTAQRNFLGSVKLTCQSVQPAPNTTCELPLTAVRLTGTQANGSVLIHTQSGLASALLLPLSSLLLAPSALRRRRNLWGRFVLTAVGVCFLLAGCADNRPGDRLPYTPPGTYQYQITATAQADAAITSTVQVTLVVQ